jgi:ATP-dependent helicase Lhr and Lhr-like helicase
MVRHAFRRPTEPQLRGLAGNRAGHDVLISAPTGSGKTLAAFLTASTPGARARLGPLPDQTEIVYVSPLKALSNDVHKNLEVPLAEIAALAARARHSAGAHPRRAAHRRHAASGAPAHDAQRPHILVTTPESLYILLTAAKPREMLAHVRT